MNKFVSNFNPGELSIRFWNKGSVANALKKFWFERVVTVVDSSVVVVLAVVVVVMVTAVNVDSVVVSSGRSVESECSPPT